MKRIISVSRRTDIPAFYADWLLNRIKEGYAGDPKGKRGLVSLKPEDVLCFVFWSKNYQPFQEALKLINMMRYNSIFHFTITGLPKEFECNLVETQIAVETLKAMSKQYSPKHIIWRYDPIIISDKTPRDFHIQNFTALASKLAGHVERCTISYLDLTGKVKLNLEKFQAESGIKLIKPDKDTRIGLANELASIAEAHGMSMCACCENDLVNDKIGKSRCVDGEAIGKLFQVDTSGIKRKGQRPACGCTESTDIGRDNTCPHGCVYCYANGDKDKAKEAYIKHDKNSVVVGRSKADSDEWIAELQAKEQQKRKCAQMIPKSKLVKGKAKPAKLPKTREEMQALIEQDRSLIHAQITKQERAAFDTEFYPEETLKESFDGFSNVLVVAPHGFPGDDNNTDYVAYFLSKELGASYLINNKKYRKPQKKMTYGIPANLNDPWEDNKHTKRFIDRLFAGIQKIRDQSGTTPIVITIHGMEDVNANKHDLDFCIGAGYTARNRKSAYGKNGNATASGAVVDGFLKALKNGHRVKDGIPGFTGRKSIPGYLKTKEKKISLVNAVQLEMRYTGLREPEKIVDTSKLLANVIRRLGEYKKMEEKATTPRDLVLAGEAEPDIALVDKAYRTLTEIFSKHFENAMLEAGRFIIKEFYNADIELARTNRPIKGVSLNQLIQNLQNRASNAPSKSWIYNAVNLVVDNEDFSAFHTYGKLLLSHKVLLFSIDNREDKEKLIKETVDKGYTIKQLRNRISEFKKNGKPRIDQTKNLPQLIKKPDLLFSEDFSSVCAVKSLVNLGLPTLNKLQDKVEEKITDISKYIEGLKSDIQTQKRYIGQYHKFIGFVETAKKQKAEEASKKPKRSKFQDWVYKTVSCCNGCSNDCVYCFAKGDAVHGRTKIEYRLTLDEWKEGKVRPHDVNKNQKRRTDPVMFPGTHDINPGNFEACFTVLKKLLTAGNRVLIVSKPRIQLITKICEDLEEYKKNMLFRFTIGSINDDILSFWEPHAPSYNERKESLKYAYDNGYRTSVSIEPMLDAEHIEELVDDLSPFVNHSIWIGKMNHLWHFDTDEQAAKNDTGRIRAETNTAYYGGAKAKKIREETEKIVKGQSKASLKKVYEKLKDKKLNGKDEPLVEWKWHIKEALGLPQPETPEQWPLD